MAWPRLMPAPRYERRDRCFFWAGCLARHRRWALVPPPTPGLQVMMVPFLVWPSVPSWSRRHGAPGWTSGRPACGFSASILIMGRFMVLVLRGVRMRAGGGGSVAGAVDEAVRVVVEVVGAVEDREQITAVGDGVERPQACRVAGARDPGKELHVAGVGLLEPQPDPVVGEHVAEFAVDAGVAVGFADVPPGDVAGGGAEQVAGVAAGGVERVVGHVDGVAED